MGGKRAGGGSWPFPGGGAGCGWGTTAGKRKGPETMGRQLSASTSAVASLADEAERLSEEGKYIEAIKIWNGLQIPLTVDATAAEAQTEQLVATTAAPTPAEQDIGRLCVAVMSSKLAMGDHRGALYCWEQGRRTGWKPDSDAYALALEACSMVKRKWRWKMALSLLAEMKNHGVRRNENHFHCAITACSQAKQPQAVFSLLSEMDSDSRIVPLSRTVTVALASCKPGREGTLVALQLLREVRRLDFPIVEAGYNKVLQMCSSTGEWEAALGILDDMAEEGANKAVVGPTLQHYEFAARACANAQPVRWREALRILKEASAKIPCDHSPPKLSAIVIAALESSQQRRRAVVLLEQLLAAAPRHTTVQYNLLIDACAKARHWQHAVSLFNELTNTSQNIAPDLFTYNSLINACARSGRTREALQTFEDMRNRSKKGKGGQVKPDIVSFSTAIHACALEGNGERASTLLREMVQEGVTPSPRTYSSCIVACEKGGRTSEALDLFDEMTSKGLDPDRLAFNSAITAAGRRGQASRALSLLEDMEKKEKMEGHVIKPDRYSFNSAMSACIRARRWDDAIRLVGRMKEAGVEPDKVTYTNLVKCHAERRNWQGALDILGDMKTKGVAVDVVCYNAAISACAKCRRPDEAESLLRDMLSMKLQPDAYTYNGLISAYAQTANWSQAIVALEIMREKKLRISVVSYSTAIYACERGRQWERALDLLKRLEMEDGLQPGTYAYNIAASACAKCGKHEKALATLEQMKERGLDMDTMSYGISTFTYTRTGNWEACLELLKRMKATNVRRDWYSYHNTLVALTKAQEYEKGLRVFEEMKSDGVKPDLSCYNTVMRMCERGGMWQHAMTFLSEMEQRHGVKPIAFHLNCTIGACYQARALDKIPQVEKIWEMIQHPSQP